MKDIVVAVAAGTESTGTGSDEASLTTVLKYHVVSGSKFSGRCYEYRLLQCWWRRYSNNFRRKRSDCRRSAKWSATSVTEADLEVSNGVIHGIGAVLLP